MPDFLVILIGLGVCYNSSINFSAFFITTLLSRGLEKVGSLLLLVYSVSLVFFMEYFVYLNYNEFKEMLNSIKNLLIINIGDIIRLSIRTFILAYIIIASLFTIITFLTL